MTQSGQANYINHITVVGDESSSMTRHTDAFNQVYDNLIEHLVERSRHHAQETRVTTYLFNSTSGIRCVTYDKDVLREVTMKGRYRPAGMTPLVKATLLSIDDQRLIPQKYGSHAFLTFVITDGQENQGGNGRTLHDRIVTAPANETYAVFVPDQHGVFEAKQYGFPGDNISVWDTTRTAGVENVGATMRAAAETFMEGRTYGIHGYGGVASASAAGLFKVRDFSASEIQAAAVPLTRGSYFFLDVSAKERIDEFVSRETKKPYEPGRSFYQFMKTETIQPSKRIAVELNGDVYTGPGARKVLGLPDGTSVRAKDVRKDGMTVFVESKSYNRNLIPGTRLLQLR